MSETEYDAARQRNKNQQPKQRVRKPQRPMKRKNFRDYLPPEQWETARKFLYLVSKLKKFSQSRRAKTEIDLAELKKAYEALPVCQ